MTSRLSNSSWTSAMKRASDSILLTRLETKSVSGTSNIRAFPIGSKLYDLILNSYAQPLTGAAWTSPGGRSCSWVPRRLTRSKTAWRLSCIVKIFLM